ncbi:DUF5949 family protein [Streptomyces sp. NBC_01476]|uniref:DUF5949 family protein n=1 Tax=Streptomyces sp. NBC_01476 TaxID=2903881 RepID=UPI002E34860F|nr:DUF5949 family protein [Streptomyces sp. NBC_01476]
MSQTNTAASASSLQRRLGTLVVIPWAGEYAADGADMPFLMAYSLGDGSDGPAASEAAVLAAAREIGLPVGGEIFDVSHAPKTGISVLVEGGRAVLSMPYLYAACPVPDQWSAAARARKAVYVIFASRPWPEAAPGVDVDVETLRDFAGDPEVLGTAAHFLVPVTSVRG